MSLGLSSFKAKRARARSEREELLQFAELVEAAIKADGVPPGWGLVAERLTKVLATVRVGD